MGIPCSKKGEKENLYQNLKESWTYEGNLFQIINNEFQHEDQYINLYSLSGKVYIIEEDKKNKIMIIVKIKEKSRQYRFDGDEKSHLKNFYEEKMSFLISKEQNFQLNIVELTKYNNGGDKLIGDNIYIIKENGAKSGPLFLDLYLKDHKEYTLDTKNNLININVSGVELSKVLNLNDPKDILKNSLCGMNNLINTCYINSSFQILIHIPQFIKIILKNQKYEIKIIKEINEIFKQILKIYKEFRPIINPKSFVYCFKSNHYTYNNYSQMDSQMFLEELIWDINTELGKFGEKRTNQLFGKIDKNEKELNFTNYIDETESETHFEINDLFYVYFIHEKKCKECGHSTYYFDESLGLKLNFENTEYKSKIDIVSLILENFKNPIEIKSRILCQNCKKSYDLIEITRIVKLPEIFILTLQKGNNENTQKIPWIVEFKENIKIIDIKEIVDSDLINDTSCLYELFAINNHLGSTPQSGHYFSEIYLEDLKAWYSFNDESVDKDPNYKVPKISNYILFYKQINKNN